MIDQQLQFYTDSISRLISGLKADQDETRMLELLQTALKNNPSKMISIFNKSIDKAKKILGQDRGTSSASYIFPVETAIRYLGAKKGLFDKAVDPFSASLWTSETILEFLSNQKNEDEVIEIAASHTMAKNLPQRAAHILYLADNIPELKSAENILFVEIGCSAGFVTKGLAEPQKFNEWLKTDLKLFQPKANQKIEAIGIELKPPEIDWVLATIGDDNLRKEVRDFNSTFTNQVQIIQADAFSLSLDTKKIKELNITPVIIACAMLYQLPKEKREELEYKIKKFIQEANGYYIKTDPAKYMGYPNMPGNWISWAEDQTGSTISPKLLLKGKTLLEWTIL